MTAITSTRTVTPTIGTMTAITPTRTKTPTMTPTIGTMTAITSTRTVSNNKIDSNNTTRTVMEQYSNRTKTLTIGTIKQHQEQQTN